MNLRRPLWWALAVSVLLHATWLIDIDWRWPWQPPKAENSVLERTQAKAIRRVRLAAAGTLAEPGVPQVYLIPAARRTSLAEANETQREQKPHRPRPQPASPDKPAQEVPEAIAATTAEAALIAAAAPVEEPAPTFPLSVQAVQDAHYMGFQLTLRQQWLMEGRRYLIRNQASKFGFTAEITSEGTLSAEHGLQPEHYRLLLNRNLKHYADFDRDNGELVHGKAGARRTTPLTPDFQDMASLPFHVAVTYDGQSDKQLKVTSGSSVYDIVLKPVAEETLQLPGGRVRTLHLVGMRTRDDGSTQAGYDIWLAPAYRNFPVRFSGPDSKGNILEMSVISLSFEGKAVFGRDVPLPSGEQGLEALPPDLLRQHDMQDSAPAPAPAETPEPSAGTG